VSAVIEPRRPSSAELVREVAVAALQRAPAPPEHTVGLTLNAKGDVQIEVTGRGHDLDAIALDVEMTFDRLRQKYRPNGERAVLGVSDDATRAARKAAAIASASVKK
jgi:hypothetical protein